MGLAYFISTEKPVRGFDATSISGKAVAGAEKELATVCKQLKVPDLMSFFSMPTAALASLIGEEPPAAPQSMADALDELRALSGQVGMEFGDLLTPEEEAKVRTADPSASAEPPAEAWFL